MRSTIGSAIRLQRSENIEFVDDLQTFKELGEQLKLKGCHVVNLSQSDFVIKNGIGGCLKSLLGQLVSDASDVADIAVLASWYCKPANNDKPVVVIIDDMERCQGSVLADFILMLSEWVVKIPVVLIMGVTTTVDAPRRLLPSNALQQLRPCKFMLGSPTERMNAIVEAVLLRPCSGFTVGYKVSLFLRDYFTRHDGTVTSFIKAMKIACMKHFSMEPLSFLGCGIFDEDFQSFSRDVGESLPYATLKYAFDLPSCQRDLPAVSLSHLLNILEGHTQEMAEVHQKVQELQLALRSEDDGNNIKPAAIDLRKRSIYRSPLNVEKGSKKLNEKASILMEDMIRDYLKPIESAPFHEIICFKHVDVLQSLLQEWGSSVGFNA
ncbi:hypothetical protein QJS04_geneDACA008950 [Acorus gramineus]|uniref:Origin recognition complex subunit 3 N-terminal domain-containing protein n=1 Tax=Acorus gramineus TaxID=55184 RepID=A0AAV9ABI3_ACOGR|nr:hypothetical protein QJS04_geneDACA008950 [Acorus gramineus]